MNNPSEQLALKILPRAWSDLLEIGHDCLRSGSRLDASAITCDIVKKLKQLQSFSMLGKATPLDNLNELKYLMLQVGKYQCIYRRIDNAVYVYHITDLQQDYPKLVK